jgi:hypothetical protein
LARRRKPADDRINPHPHEREHTINAGGSSTHCAGRDAADANVHHQRSKTGGRAPFLAVPRRRRARQERKAVRLAQPPGGVQGHRAAEHPDGPVKTASRPPVIRTGGGLAIASDRAPIIAAPNTAPLAIDSGARGNVSRSSLVPVVLQIFRS